jgi:DHA2 family multidrug resistance protein
LSAAIGSRSSFQPQQTAALLNARGLDGETGALAQMVARLRGQAAVMSFIDIFLIITVLFAGLALGALLMKPPPKNVKVDAH